MRSASVGRDSVTIAGAGAPTGITVTGETVAVMETSVPVTIAAGATAVAGMANVSITGAAAGITVAPQILTLTVTAAPAGMTGQIGMGLEGEKAYDQFGTSVALSDDGKRVVAGANLNDGTASEAGHARVFERSGNSWVQVGADLDGEAAGDRFGTSVAISADGARVAVGSYLNDGGGGSSGNVRVFDFAAGAWTQVGADIDGTAGDGAGWAIDLSASGHRIVIGGPGVGSVSGDVRVYELMGAAWTQLGGTITETHELGHAVSMSAAGNRIAVGQPSAVGISRPGSVLIYDWDGTAWTPVGAPLVGEGIADTFGTSLDSPSQDSEGSVRPVQARLLLH